MNRRIRLYILALIFLSMAVLSGRITGELAGDNETASAVLSSGAERIGGVLASVLWLQLDRYHHIWMYQGNDWVTDTEYLPQLWLITKLDPTFAEAYIDGGYHLVINLGHPEEGFELLQEGVIQCPDNERMLWERAVVLWETNYYGPRATCQAAWAYIDLIRSKRGVISEPWNEANAYFIIGSAFEKDVSRLNSSRIARRYDERCSFIRSARIEGLWTN
jgi:hypothetical protein